MARSTPAGRTAELLRDQTSLSVNHMYYILHKDKDTDKETGKDKDRNLLDNSRAPEGPNITVCQSQGCFHVYYTFTNTKTETNTQAKTTGPFKKHPQAPPKGPNMAIY